MNVLRKVLIAAGVLAVILFVCIALLAAILGQSASESFRSSWSYDLQVSTSGPLDDAVLLIPIPSRYDPETGTNVTPLDLSRASFSHFDRDKISVTIEHVDGVPMLKISADRIDPVYKLITDPIVPGQNESVSKPTQITTGIQRRRFWSRWFHIWHRSRPRDRHQNADRNRTSLHALPDCRYHQRVRRTR